MSVEIADFQIFHGVPQFTLTENATSQNIPCSLPADISPAAGGVLAFTVRNVEATSLGGGTAVLDLELFVNGQKIENYKIQSGTVSGLVAHCPHTGNGKLKAGANTIKFATPSSTGESITISDVVLWFQRNV